MNEVVINDLYGYKSYKYLNKVINYSLDKLNVENKSVSIILVDEKYIKNINKEYRGKDQITDVISFAFLDNEMIPDESLLGDIYICIPRMKEQAINYGHSEKRELSFLAIHGILHLLGYDHINEKDEKIMFELQDEILNELNIRREL